MGGDEKWLRRQGKSGQRAFIANPTLFFAVVANEAFCAKDSPEVKWDNQGSPFSITLNTHISTSSSTT
jgi:heme/copper-type cytochrome/quinol oxidase subunit 3